MNAYKDTCALNLNMINMSLCVLYRGNSSSIASSNSEANDLELLEDIEESSTEDIWFSFQSTVYISNVPF